MNPNVLVVEHMQKIAMLANLQEHTGRDARYGIEYPHIVADVIKTELAAEAARLNELIRGAYL